MHAAPTDKEGTTVKANVTYHFDPVDLQQLRLLSQLSPGRRIQALLEARELAVGLRRGRLRRLYHQDRKSVVRERV